MVMAEYIDLKARIQKASGYLALIKKISSELSWYEVIKLKAIEQNQTKRQLWAEEKIFYFTKKLIEAKISFKDL